MSSIPVSYDTEIKSWVRDKILWLSSLASFLIIPPHYPSQKKKTDGTACTIKKAMIVSLRTFTFHYSAAALPLGVKQPEQLKTSLNKTEKIRH